MVSHCGHLMLVWLASCLDNGNLCRPNFIACYKCGFRSDSFPLYHLSCLVCRPHIYYCPDCCIRNNCFSRLLHFKRLDSSLSPSLFFLPLNVRGGRGSCSPSGKGMGSITFLQKLVFFTSLSAHAFSQKQTIGH